MSPEIEKKLMKEARNFHDSGNFWAWAYTDYRLSTKEADVIWRNANWKFKYVICESRKGYDNRMFIRDVSNAWDDGLKKKGWWNTFTLSTRPVAEGLWLCQVDHYRIDSNGYINLIINPLVEMPEVKFHFGWWEKEEGTWNSPAFNLMFNGNRKWLPEYKFPQFKKGNVREFISRFPRYTYEDYYGYEYMCNLLLMDYIKGDISLEEIESALNEPTDHEKFIRQIQLAVAKGKAKEMFPNHPLFAEKICRPENSASRLLGDRYTGFREVEDYVERNLRSYEQLVKEEKMNAIDSSDDLDKIEAVLAYRKEVKKAEKLAKRNKRKRGK